MLDLNAGIPGFDEAAMLSAMVKTVNEVVDVPLCIDSSTPEALEAAVPLAGGKVLINSVTAEQHSMDRLLPLVAEYGAAVIGMANDETGISMDPDERFAAAAQDRRDARPTTASAREDVIIDPLAMPIGAAPDAGHRDVRDDAADPRRARREPVVRRLEHLLRDARPPRDRRRVPHADDRGRHEHGDHEPAAPPRAQGDPRRERPAARPRRVRRGVDRRPPRGAGGRGGGE